MAPYKCKLHKGVIYEQSISYSKYPKNSSTTYSTKVIKIVLAESNNHNLCVVWTDKRIYVIYINYRLPKELAFKKSFLFDQYEYYELYKLQIL